MNTKERYQFFLETIGFETTDKWRSSVLTTATHELIVNGYFLLFDGEEIHFYRKYPDGCYGRVAFEDIKHKWLRKRILVCKAVREILFKDYEIDGYGDDIFIMLLHMLETNRESTKGCCEQASGNQESIAVGYYRKVRKGEWW